MGLIFDSVNDRISSTSGPVSFPGRIDAPASTTGTAGLRLPHGTAPSSPTNGDVWTTTTGIYARINGATVGPFSGAAGSDTQIQYNNAGALAGISLLIYNSGASRMDFSSGTFRFLTSDIVHGTGSFTHTGTGNFAWTGSGSYFEVTSTGPINLTGAKTTFFTPTTSAASINLPHGTAPSAPADGDVWTTTTGTFVRVNGGTVEIGFRSIPRSTTTTTAAIGDRGRCIAVTGNIDIPASVFAAGDALSIYNNSGSSVSITQGSGLTMYLVGTATTGNRTLAQRGLVTIWFNSATECVISGGGLT